MEKCISFPKGKAKSIPKDSEENAVQEATEF